MDGSLPGSIRAYLGRGLVQWFFFVKCHIKSHPYLSPKCQKSLKCRVFLIFWELKCPKSRAASRRLSVYTSKFDVLHPKKIRCSGVSFPPNNFEKMTHAKTKIDRKLQQWRFYSGWLEVIFGARRAPKHFDALGLQEKKTLILLLFFLQWVHCGSDRYPV